MSEQPTAAYFTAIPRSPQLRASELCDQLGDKTPAGQRLTMSEPAFSYYPRLQRLRDFVESDVSHHISLRDAARVAAYETTYFCAWFHKRVGIRFMEWLTLVRICKATELMRSRDYAIWEVAKAAGFQSVRAFERAFKRVTGLSPREYKMLARPS